MHAFQYVEIHAARAHELAAEAAAWHLAREAAPTPAVSPARRAPALLTVLPAVRNRVGEALVSVGIRLMQPAHLQSRVHRHAA
ncbi:hypothetical protein AB0P15_26560 [Streptomyces sp. NPDC087917]|uniref:hypothetical protein n=1 Tax=unclassified Streptomyces TaxID=2593676 RepID=UPI00343EFFB5